MPSARKWANFCIASALASKREKAPTACFNRFAGTVPIPWATLNIDTSDAATVSRLRQRNKDYRPKG